MSEDKRISNIENQSEALAKKKDWMNRLESLSGKPIDKSNGLTYLLIDCSGSMSDDNKLTLAKNGGKDYAKDAKLKGYAVGLIKFDSNAALVLEPKSELVEFNSKIESLSIGGSTNMADAITISVTHLANKFGNKVICIATDGHPDDREATISAAERAKKAGIEIMTIGTPDADNEFLRRLATRKELAVEVKTHQLQEGIKSMANLLPSRT